MEILGARGGCILGEITVFLLDFYSLSGYLKKRINCTYDLSSIEDYYKFSYLDL